ncbi:MAG: hypothetical protein E7679_01275 [Ruminococcaceae bacterium]|nr:hypothetical protein [Oscillospiraceae bacterium]
MNLNERSERTKKLAICAMLSALGVVVLYLGSLVEVLDISMAVIASLFVIFAVIEYGGAAPWAIFFVTGILSTVLLPNKFPAVMYLLFLGFYPIIKEKIEHLRSRAWQWVIKEAVFNVCLVLLMMMSKYFLYYGVEGLEIFEAVFFLLANGTFVIYDIALTRLISLYVFRLRKKFRIK